MTSRLSSPGASANTRRPVAVISPSPSAALAAVTGRCTWWSNCSRASRRAFRRRSLATTVCRPPEGSVRAPDQHELARRLTAEHAALSGDGLLRQRRIAHGELQALQLLLDPAQRLACGARPGHLR